MAFINSLPTSNPWMNRAQLMPKTDELEGPAGLKLGSLNPAEAPIGTERSSAPQFTSVIDRLVNDVNGKMQTAEVEKSKVLSGESTNLHQSMIAMQEAGVAFSLMVEVRNKLVESYQELMRMQV